MKTLDEWLSSLRATQEQYREVEWLVSRQEAKARDAEWQARVDAARAEMIPTKEEVAARDAIIKNGGYTEGLREAADLVRLTIVRVDGYAPLPMTALADEIEALIAKANKGRNHEASLQVSGMGRGPL